MLALTITHSRGIADFPDIRSDQDRLEHVEALTGVLRDLLDSNMMPNATDFLAIYGRVIHSFPQNLIWRFYYKNCDSNCRWLSMPSAFWIRKWIRLRRESIWVFRLLITAVRLMRWRHSMEPHYSSAPYKICLPSIGRRSVLHFQLKENLDNHLYSFFSCRFSYRTSI